MRTRISAQLILGVTVVSVAVFALLAYFLIDAQWRSLIAQLESHAFHCTETIKSSTRHAMMRDRREEVQEILETIARQESIRRVRVFNKEGRIMVSPDQEETGTMVDLQAEACYGCHAEDRPLQRLSTESRTRIFEEADGSRSLGIINPIYNEASCSEADCHAHPESQSVLGVLDVTVSLDEVQREMVDGRNKAMLLTALAVFSTSAIVLLLFHYRVGRPVRDLLAATRRVADGDLSTRIDIRRDDELGELESSFNEMTRRLVETQTQLYQSNKAASVGRLAAGIAHEINNPLTGVLTFGSLLLREAPEGSELRDGLETIVNETKRCREIVKGLLNFSRQVPPRMASVDFNEIVRSALGIVDHQFGVSNIKVTTGLAEHLPPVRVDSGKMEQVLLNLLVNAADAIGPKGGEIFVGTESTEVEGRRWIEIKVADDGQGISEEDQAKLFEPFFTTKETGTGLGLAVVWGIVSEHEGSITVSSQLGRGAVFVVRLPVSEPSMRAPQSSPDGEPGEQTER